MSRYEPILESWNHQLRVLSDEGNREACHVLRNCILDLKMVMDGGSTLTRMVTMWEGRLESARRMHSVEEEYVLENVLNDMERECV
jgi:hypothetical protein